MIVDVKITVCLSLRWLSKVLALFWEDWQQVLWFWVAELVRDLIWDLSRRNDTFALFKLKKNMQQWEASFSNLVLIKYFLFFFPSAKEVCLENQNIWYKVFCA